MSAAVGCFYFTGDEEEEEEEREDSLGRCCTVCLPHFLVALLLLSAGHKVTTQHCSSLSAALGAAEFCPKPRPPRSIKDVFVSDVEV